ncbi:glycosyltransferase [Acidobacteria bacterium AH-259-A15]|nr:glycosyltransferase [Acidobacteria bacterium AH-259-A15]
MISVVVPVRNSSKTLRECLKALKTQSVGEENYETIVVDDRSSDGSGRVAEDFGVRMIWHEKRGAAAARNRGVQEAKGDVVLFTDADCVVDDQWVEKLSRLILAGGFVGAVGQCDSDQKHWVAALIQVELDERYSRMGHQDRIDFLNTGNCAFKRKLLLENPFDESFHWLEDVELSFRLARNGSQMVFVPDARVRHPHPESLWEYLKRKFRYASFAPTIYRRYPEKAISDSRTPVNRRIQLLLLGLSIVVLPFSGLLGLVSLLGSIAFSMPVTLRAFQRSVKLGILAPVLVLMGNIAFLLGTVWGLIPRNRSHR